MHSRLYPQTAEAWSNNCHNVLCHNTLYVKIFILFSFIIFDFIVSTELHIHVAQKCLSSL